jgi:methyl-accepting chemotaxis protein
MTKALSTVGSAGALFGFFYRVSAFCNSFLVATDDETLPPDESGELMRRCMEPKSWLDKLASNWSKRSFLEKTGYMVGINLTSGFIGLVVSAPTLIMLAAIFLSSIVHMLLVSHHKNRLNGAKLLVTETVALNVTLRENKKMFGEEIATLRQAIKDLKAQSDTFKGQVNLLDVENKKIQETNNELLGVTTILQSKVGHLNEQQTLVESNFKTLSVHLSECDQKITQSIAAVATVSYNASQFSESVDSMQQQQRVFSEAVNRFCLFVNKQPPAEKGGAISNGHDDALMGSSDDSSDEEGMNPLPPVK